MRSRRSLDAASRAYHLPVMRDEVVALLDPQPGKVMVDATAGGGGHAALLAERLVPGGRLIGLDQDAEAIGEARKVLAPFGDAVTLVQARFDTLPEVLFHLKCERVDGILFDLGVSSHQLDTPERGFSFQSPDAALDMRMNPNGSGPTAAEILNTLSERDLAVLIRENSDERWAGRIAQFVVERRREAPFIKVGQLVEAVLAAIPAGARPQDKHAATRTFQALRIAVNQELTVLQQALIGALECLRVGGVIAVLSYHSIEDRIIKQFFAQKSGKGAGEGPYGTRPAAVLELLTKRPLPPSAEEVAVNPRARSAYLRAARRILD